MPSSVNLISLRLVSALLVAGCAGVFEMESRESKEYRNSEYGYAVRIPDRVESIEATAPNPNHGVRLRTRSNATIWLNAAFSDDSSSADLVASERADWGNSCKSFRVMPTTLASLPAALIAFTCGTDAKQGEQKFVLLLVTLRSDPGGGRVKYEIGLQEFRRLSVNRSQFEALRASFRFIARK